MAAEVIREATAPGQFEVAQMPLPPYANAIDGGLGDRANHSQIVKVYSKPEEGRERDSPGHFIALEKAAISGMDSGTAGGPSEFTGHEFAAPPALCQNH